MDAETKKEIDRLDRRIDDVRADVRAAKSDVAAEMKSGWAAVTRHIDDRIPAQFTTRIDNIEESVRKFADTVTAREERKKTELEQETERLAQEERRLALEEKRLRNDGLRIQNESGQHNALKIKAEAEEVPVDSTHKRRIAVYGVLVTAGSGLLALIASAVASHH